jgi:hypothetical protein
LTFKPFVTEIFFTFLEVCVGGQEELTTSFAYVDFIGIDFEK